MESAKNLFDHLPQGRNETFTLNVHLLTEDTTLCRFVPSESKHYSPDPSDLIKAKV